MSERYLIFIYESDSTQIIDITPIQNPGELVTVTAAIKPPGFQVFLFNEVQIIDRRP